jgi:PAS domain-containing protein
LIRVPLRIELHTFPSDDAVFRDDAEAAFAGLDAPDPERLQHSIRTRYPWAVVRERSELAKLSLDETVWYVFRRALVDPPAEPWWENGHAWAVIDCDRTVVDAGEALAAIVELPRAALIGRRIEDLANPADPTATADVAALWVELLARGEAHGTLRFNRLDGTPREIEYHVDSVGVPAGRFRAVVRES